MTDLICRDQLLLPVPEPAALGRGQADEFLEALLGPVGGGVLQQGPQSHDKSHLAGGEQIPDADGRKHGDDDEQGRGDLADTGIVDDPPHCQIEQRDAADDHGHPGRVDGQINAQPGQDETGRQKDRAHQRHREACQ